MSELPTTRSPWMPAENLDPVDVARGYRASKAVVNEGERRLSQQEAAEAEVRARVNAEDHRTGLLFSWGPGAEGRARARRELQDRHFEVWRKIDGAEQGEMRALKAEFGRREAEVHERFSRQKQDAARLQQIEYQTLVEDQKSGFDLGLAEWVLQRGAERQRLELFHRNIGGNERDVARELADWERMNPRPGRR